MRKHEDMRKHIELVGMLYFVWGSIAVLIGFAFLILAFGTASIITVEGRGFAVGFASAVFGVLAGIALTWGAVHIWDAVKVRHHSHAGRAVALILAVLNLILIPFGTALGIYALWVLTQEEARPLFEHARTVRPTR